MFVKNNYEVVRAIGFSVDNIAFASNNFIATDRASLKSEYNLAKNIQKASGSCVAVSGLESYAIVER